MSLTANKRLLSPSDTQEIPHIAGISEDPGAHLFWRYGRFKLADAIDLTYNL
jgi:hypothetical protein